MKFALLTSFLIISIIEVISQDDIDWCDPSLCSPDRQHIACDNSGVRQIEIKIHNYKIWTNIFYKIDFSRRL